MSPSPLPDAHILCFPNQGLREVASTRPADPFDFIASFLEQKGRAARAAPSQPPPARACWSVAAERAVSLSYLCSFYERLVRPIERNAGRLLTTGCAASVSQYCAYASEKAALLIAACCRLLPLSSSSPTHALARTRRRREVVAHVIMPATSSDHCRFADLPAPEGPGAANLWDPAGETPLWFVSHAFGNPFSLLVTSLSAHFAAAGAVPSEVFLWLDVIAINQHNTDDELRGGSTLQRTIDISVATLVVLDRERRLPLSRLWWCARATLVASRPPHTLTVTRADRVTTCR